MYMDDLDPESGDAMDAILSNAANMLGRCWTVLLSVMCLRGVIVCMGRFHSILSRVINLHLLVLCL